MQGKAFGTIRNIDFKNNLPALSQLLMECGCFYKKVKIESVQRTVLRWIRSGLPLNRVSCIAKSLNKEIDFFLPHKENLNIANDKIKNKQTIKNRLRLICFITKLDLQSPML